jgi:hypothetical protein
MKTNLCKMPDNVYISVTFFILIYMFDNTLYGRGHRGHDRMVVGFITTHAISAYHH